MPQPRLLTFTRRLESGEPTAVLLQVVRAGDTLELLPGRNIQAF